jgi:hypothetical protein
MPNVGIKKIDIFLKENSMKKMSKGKYRMKRINFQFFPERFIVQI